MSETANQATNTDRELYREPDVTGHGSYYSDSVHVTERGGIGINCGGHVIVLPLREWHNRAKLAMGNPLPDAPASPALGEEELVRSFSERVRQIAFSIAAPNPYTPQLVQLSNAFENAALSRASTDKVRELEAALAEARKVIQAFDTQARELAQSYGEDDILANPDSALSAARDWLTRNS